MQSTSLWDFIGASEDPLYKWILLEFVLLIALNLVSLVIGSSNLSLLKASKSQWWGSITSIGLYDAWESTVVLLILPFFWLFLNTRIRSVERRNRSLLFMSGSIVAAVLANYVWVVSPSLYHFTFGVSGFDVAAGGIILVFAVVNLISVLKPSPALDSPQPRSKDKRAMKSFLLFIYIVMMLIMVLVPTTLVVAGDPTINTQVHVDSFLFSIGMAIVFEAIIVLRRMTHLPATAEPGG